jgi:23S rRNA U2552 (ribose-2'-O)-methylase RlmE/FtsJ
MNLLDKCVLRLNNHSDKIIWNDDNIEQKGRNIFEVEELLKKNKQRIDEIPKNIWNNCKKIINDFESLNIINKQNINIGIANHIPISRAFFKMWEIINDFNLLDSSENLIYGALCEGPGGFIEAFNMYRKNKFNNVKDTIVGMTLKNENDTLVPSWKKSQKILKECNRIYITYGADNTGNIYNINNIEAYTRLFKEYKADLITADGGFDFSDDYNNQENKIIHLLWCETITGLLSLKTNGTMIIKIFDCFENTTIDILYILSYCFQSVYIVKPLTSRPLNSEKYIVAIDYKNNLEEEDKNMIIMMTSKMNNIEYNRFIKNRICNEFIECINAMNTAFAFRQIRYINKIFNIYKNNIYNIPMLYKEKVIYCICWCKKYNFQINYKSNLLV